MNNKYKILVVEDERNIVTLLTALLEANGCKVLAASDCQGGGVMFRSHVPDLIILDLGLPDGDGSDLLRQIRDVDLTPVIVLSARGDEDEKVRLLDAGANDYITKPFGTAELLARVRSALRDHRNSTPESMGQFNCGELTVQYDSRRVFLRDEEIKLTQTEYNILSFLARSAGKMMTYAAIIKAIWHEIPDDGNIKRLQVNMANIRKKLGTRPGESGYVINELGVGYRLREE